QSASTSVHAASRSSGSQTWRTPPSFRSRRRPHARGRQLRPGHLAESAEKQERRHFPAARTFAHPDPPGQPARRLKRHTAELPTPTANSAFAEPPGGAHATLLCTSGQLRKHWAVADQALGPLLEPIRQRLHDHLAIGGVLGRFLRVVADDIAAVIHPHL